MKCAKECLEKRKCCEEQECRMWIEYKEDLNCTLIASAGNPGMTLKEVGKRLQLSTVRIKQIQDKALRKLEKKGIYLIN